MIDLKQFALKIGPITNSHVDRAVALLWYYRTIQSYKERTASELALDLHELGFPKPNISRFHKQLSGSKMTIRGKRQRTFQLDARKLDGLDSKFASIAKIRRPIETDSVIPIAQVQGTRNYLEQLVVQINGCYDNGWFDACAVLCRRIMESLIIESYLAHGMRSKIEERGIFKQLDGLIASIKNETVFKLARNSGKTMDTVKITGDAAAHGRTYLIQIQDIDDMKAKFRLLIDDLMSTSKLK